MLCLSLQAFDGRRPPLQQRRILSAVTDRRYRASHTFGGHRPLLQSVAYFRRSQTAATTASDASPVVDRRYRASHTFGGHRPPLQRHTFGGHRPSLQRTSTQLRKSDTLRSVHNRLGRLDRIYLRALIYFLTACTAQRRPLLAKKDV